MRVDAEQHVALGDGLPLLISAFDDDPARTRTHIGAAVGGQSSRLLRREGLCTALDDAHDRFRRRIGLVLWISVGAGGEHENTGDQAG